MTGNVRSIAGQVNLLAGRRKIVAGQMIGCVVRQLLRRGGLLPASNFR